MVELDSIIVQDKNWNILFGRFSVRDRNELRHFFHSLINIGFEKRVSEEITCDELFDDGVKREDYSLVMKRFTDYQIFNSKDSFVSYTKTVIFHRYRNVILILLSLLGDVKASDFEQSLTKLFFKHGIFYTDSIDRVWPECLNRILLENEKEKLKEGKLSLEYMALKMLFDEHIIAYDVCQCFSKSDCVFADGLSVTKAKQIHNNTDFIFSDSIMKQLHRKRK